MREKSSIQRRCERHNDRASNPCRSRPVKFLKTAASSQLCGSQAWMHHEPHAMDPVRIFTRARAAIPLLSHHTCTPAHPTASADSSQVQHTDDHLASDAELHTFTLTPGFTLACWGDTKEEKQAWRRSRSSITSWYCTRNTRTFVAWPASRKREVSKLRDPRPRV